jgi:hypothetical protein
MLLSCPSLIIHKFSPLYVQAMCTSLQKDVPALVIPTITFPIRLQCSYIFIYDLSNNTVSRSFCKASNSMVIRI